MRSSIFIKNFKSKKSKEDIKISISKKIVKNLKKLTNIYFGEKRRSNQLHTVMDYDFFPITVGQFFSKDVLKILQSGKFICSFFGKKVIKSEMLLYGFFDPQNTSLSIFQTGSLTEEKITEKLCEKFNYPINLKKSNNIFSKFNKAITISEQISFEPEIYHILKFAAKIAKQRFKTPVITQEIFFIALLESRKSTAGKLLRQIIPTKEAWFLLRYKFIEATKKIEKLVDIFIPSGLLYYDFILRSNISRNEFHNLLFRPINHLSFILTYRKKFLDLFLEINLLKKLQNQTSYFLFNQSE